MQRRVGRPVWALIDGLGDVLLRERRGWALALAVLPLLVLMLAPTGWNSNEHHYFAVSHAVVAPAAFGPHHAAFDSGGARLLSAWIIGGTVETLGYEGAQTLLRWVIIALYAGTLAALGHALGLSVLELVLALALFRLFGEGLIGDEWLFQGVEAKSLAYPCVLAGLALVVARRAVAGMAALVLATYLHFLVGGFWAAASLLLLLLVRDGPRGAWLRPFLVYALAVLPLVVLLATETLTADVAAVDRTLGQIIGSFRNPHHVSPFLGIETFKSWFGGIVAVVVATLLFALLTVLPDEGRERRHLHLWVLLLHGYLLAMLAASWVDRHTEHLALFFVFRPSSLTLLLALALGIHWLTRTLDAAGTRPLAVLALVVVATTTLTDAAGRANELLVEETTPADLAALIAEVEADVPPDAVILVEPRGEGDFLWPTVALERLLGRPTLVNFKFVPSAAPDVVRWYRLITWRREVFAGDCARLREWPVDYLLYVTPPPADTCGTPVWSRGRYTLVTAAAG